MRLARTACLLHKPLPQPRDRVDAPHRGYRLSRLTDLIAQAKTKDPALGSELEREFKVLSARRSFGLNFERHRPESVELPGRPVRKGDKVHTLPPRGSTAKGDQRLWKVTEFEASADGRMAKLELLYSVDVERQSVAVADLIVVAEFKDYIYPGLVSTGKIERGDDKPFHTVINGENFHALEALTFTHRGKVDAIYIDPPYNSGATDWKYNNSYVDKDDAYRHSKWLAMMERRLLIARQLLNPRKSVLIVTIDEKEYLRLGILLEQTFPEAHSQMISSMINPKGSARGKEFYRVDEYIFVLRFGSAVVQDFLVPGLCITKGPESVAENGDADPAELPKIRWASMLRSGKGAYREDSHLKFYPIYVNEAEGRIIGCGEYLPLGINPDDISSDPTIRVCWPYRSDGRQGRWQLKVESFRHQLKDGHIKIGKISPGKVTFYYLMEGQREKLLSGDLIVTGQDEYGGIEVGYANSDAINGRPKTQWTATSHSATDHGTSILAKMLPGRAFDYPKSPYAVEDALRFFIADNPNAVVLDFFSGSGTTAHAVMRLNRQDGGRRQCISVTNNEVGADEQTKLRKAGLRSGDADWEQWGICDYITKPRIAAAITGRTPKGEPIKGSYKFKDEFPMADGFEENAEFFTLTYETPVAVSHNRAFERIAPLLWMRAGSEGRRIDKLSDQGWDVADSYGLLIDLDKSAAFAEAIEGKGAVRVAYVVTDDDRRFQSVVRQLPGSVEPVRLYESYLTNFRFAMGR